MSRQSGNPDEHVVIEVWSTTTLQTHASMHVYAGTRAGLCEELGVQDLLSPAAKDRLKALHGDDIQIYMEEPTEPATVKLARGPIHLAKSLAARGQHLVHKLTRQQRQ